MDAGPAWRSRVRVTMPFKPLFIGVVVLIVLAVFMFVVMDELILMNTCIRSTRGRDLVSEDMAVNLLALTALVFTLLAVFLPHWIGVLDTLGGWLQSPLNPD
ncbi:hypothetical protein [Streptomyces mirabilis]|uniref:hypothetical protein n=1 Tax=Streptomyces mirabilis TaxID=68239 RepID=UPI00364D0BCB